MPRILIADTDDASRNAIAALAVREGWAVATAGTLERAREELERQPPDLVLADLGFAAGHALDLLDDLDHPPATGCLAVMTGSTDPATAVAALRAGAVDCLLKPLTAESLHALLARLPATPEMRMRLGALRAQLRRLEQGEPQADAPGAAEPVLQVAVGTSLDEADKRLILATLARCGGVRKHTAALLGISLKTLYNRLEEYGVPSNAARHERRRAEPTPPQTEPAEG